MSGRIILHFKEHKERLVRWWIWAAVLLLLTGILCGFSQNEGVMPVNKNLWSTSFAFVTAGGGLIGLSICYIIIDIYKVWTGAPFIYLGMNSILIYCGHSLLADYMPFSYEIHKETHANMLTVNVIGVFSWVLIAYYCYINKFFIKI